VNNFWKTLGAVVLGGLITVGANYLTSRWTADAQRKQFLIERSQAFSEFLALNYLPRSGDSDAPPECQTRLQECRELRQTAIQSYFFLPTNVQEELVKSYGDKAVAATSSSNVTGQTAESLAWDNTLRFTREWLTDQSDKNFNFVLPCANWVVEEKKCKKTP
jgi:hypothetical protein